MTDASDERADERPTDSEAAPDSSDSETATDASSSDAMADVSDPEAVADASDPDAVADAPSDEERDRLRSDENHDQFRSDEDREQLRREVEEKYDFEDFGPQDMDEMSYEEWEVAFDHDSWITGEDLLDRVEADLKSRVADRDVFAVVERIEQDGRPLLLAYSDEGYAVAYPDGSVEGSGTVLRDVKPSVALSSMESYEVPEMPEGDVLPEPAEVPEGSGKLGNQLMQIVAAVHVLAGIALFVAWIAVGLPIVAAVASLGFFVFGVFVFLLVANARLSDRFRAEEYRNRLRAVGMEDDERPEFLPDQDEDFQSDQDEDLQPNEDDELPDESTEQPDDATAGTGVSSASESSN